MAFAVSLTTRKDGAPAESRQSELDLIVNDAEKLAERRRRLSDLSWWMRCTAENIARPSASASQHISSSLQHICTKSCVCEGQGETPAGGDCHSTGEKKDDASAAEVSPYGMQRQKKAPPVTDGALVEAATETYNGAKEL